jgi:large subunit ribosomal protein L6
MTRVGKMPIEIPKGVEVSVKDSTIHIKGPKGTLQMHIIPEVNVKVEDGHVVVMNNDALSARSNFHGLFRALINNMIKGVTVGYEKILDMIGVGYRSAVQGQTLNVQVGHSHPNIIPIPKGIEVTIEKGTRITIKGIDKQVVGQFAASIRAIRPPEPYQGKGIRYADEFVRRKAGKVASKA